MEEKARASSERTVRVVAFALTLALVLCAGGAWAATQYLNDGAKQNAVTGVWDLPNKGTCYPVEGASISTRPECVATIFPTYTTSATCATAARGSFSSTTNVCLDAVNNTAGACVSAPASAAFPAGIDRKWSGGVCLLTMKGYDRNKVVCANQGGTYGPIGTVVPAYSAGACFGAWVMPDGPTFTPPLVTSIAVNGSPGPGDQCLRCHRSDTQWNVNRVRDVESMVMTGHKNMSRKVTPGTPQLGPSGVAYPTDSSGNLFNWLGGLITIGGTPTPVFWVYDGWFEAPHAPAAIYAASASTSKVCTDPRYTAQAACEGAGFSWVFNAGAAYSCGRCHTTGWTSDVAVGPSTGGFAKEPEKSFPGVTWDRSSNAPSNVVNLSGGVAGDASKYSSWDLFGITCTRCHGSVVANNVAGTLPYSAPTGFSSHNNGFTGYDAGSGYCTVAGPTASAQCTAAGGTWLTPCSDNTNTTQAGCVAAGKTWTFPSCSANNPASTAGTVGGVRQAYCSTPTNTYTTSAACTAVVGGSWTSLSALYTTSAACTAAGWTWDASGTPSCRACYVPNATYTTAAACAAVPGIAALGTVWTNAYASDVDSCGAAGGKYTGTKTQRGQTITAVCLNCHRQETSGLPNTNGSCSVAGKTTPGACLAAIPPGVWTESGNGLPVTVGPYHSTVTNPSHFHGNEYLNSPHAKFTGKFSEIATAPFGYFGTGNYQSFFISDGEAANTGNGCTGCHNVHKSTDAAANPAGGAVKECTECHAKNLNLLQHPKGVGTPLENPAESCASCHMPAGQHLFRINTAASYSTFPLPAAINGNVSANTSPDGAFTNAVWVDLDLACGQCHGGGTSNVSTTGSISSGSTVLTVASSAGFVANEKIRVAGAYSFAGLVGGVATYADLNSYVKSVDSATQITLAGTASHSVTNAAAAQNAVSNNASWFSKTTLAGYAKGIHNDKPTALFTTAYGVDGSTVVTDASASTCSGNNASCNVFDWDWNDGTAHGSGVTSSHVYTVPGTYSITLTVTQYGFEPGTTTRKFTAYATDNAPTATGTCSFAGATWVASCINTSTDDKGLSLVSINWGDGTMLTSLSDPPKNGSDTTPYTHTYLVPGSYRITYNAIDTNGQQNRNSGVITPTGDPIVAASFQYFSIAGKVFKAGGVLPLGAAQIQVKKGGVLVKSAMSAADGSYSTGAMKPGTYTMTVSKAGYTFAVPTLTVTTPGNATGQNFTAN